MSRILLDRKKIYELMILGFKTRDIGLYKSGLGYKRIAKALSIPRETIRGIIRRVRGCVDSTGKK